MANRYWVGNGGNAAGMTHWSASSGGVGGASHPGNSDDVFFDANSFSLTGETITGDFGCRNLDFSAVTNTPIIDEFFTPFIHGNLTFGNPVSFSGTPEWDFDLSSAQTLVSNGNILDINFVFGGTASASMTLLDDLVMPSSGQIAVGGTAMVFNANDFNITTGIFELSGDSNVVLNMGSGTWNIIGSSSGGNPVWLIDGAPTFNSDTSLLIFSGSSIQKLQHTTTISVAYHDFSVTNTNRINFSSEDQATASISFHDLDFIGASLVVSMDPDYDAPGSTPIVYNVTNLFTATGSPSENLIIQNNNPSVQLLLNAALTDISYVTVDHSTAGGAAIPFINSNGLDSGGNINWLFPSSGYPVYNPSIVSAVAQVQEGYSAPKFIVGGKGGSSGATFGLFKKSNSYSFAMWRSQLFTVGKPFNVGSIRLRFNPGIGSNHTIYPVLVFDDGSNVVIGDAISSTLYTESEKFLVLSPDNFNFNVHGEKNFYFELRFKGSALIDILLPIHIDLETEATI